MKTNSSEPNPVCKCGSKDFVTAARSRNHLGRNEFKLACAVCGETTKVGKTTYALFSYLADKKATPEFRKLFDLG
jgi:hypothetical protein